MRLSIVFLSAVLAVVVSSCDAASIDITKISKMATAGGAHAEVLAPLGIRSLRGYEADNEERGVFGTSIDGVVKKIMSNKISLVDAMAKAKVKKHIDKMKAQEGYLEDLFSKKTLNEMETNFPYAQRKYLEWHGLGLSDELINARLTAKNAGYGTLFDQFKFFVGTS